VRSLPFEPAFAENSIENWKMGEGPVWKGDCDLNCETREAGKVAHMRKILFIAVLVLGFSAPAMAQRGGGAAGIGGSAFGSGGGGGYGSGGLGGGFTGGLASCPPTQFAVMGVSGSNSEFEPSTFVSFDKAVAAGKQEIAIESRTVAQAARENMAARKEKARLALVQDGYGYPTIALPR
jgi:hypothetical protein